MKGIENGEKFIWKSASSNGETVDIQRGEPWDAQAEGTGNEQETGTHIQRAIILKLHGMKTAGNIYQYVADVLLQKKEGKSK